MPTTCPACKYADNSDTALVCVQCGYPLREQPKAVDIKRKTVTSLLSEDKATPEVRLREQPEKQLHRPAVAFFIGNDEEPTVVPVTHDLILGRTGSGEKDSSSIDLSAYSASENGVSRRHAMLRRLGPDVVLLDLESTNGTWLNGIRVKGNQPVTLRSGDRIMLGRLMIQVFLPH